MKSRFSLLMLTAALFTTVPSAQLKAQDDIPVTVDSRIRTMVYSPNEVFKMYTEYGYQSSIEFSPDEQISTISLGSPSAFRITPSRNRLFIKALQKGRHTNMTVLTTERAYQFELYSDIPSDDSIIYVMRFYYPEANLDDIEAVEMEEQAKIEEEKINSTDAIEKPSSPSVAPPASAMNITEQPEADGAPAAPQADNYNYSLSGPETVSPLKIYDNGKQTYFKFPANVTPLIMGVRADGTEYALVTQQANDMLVIDQVLPRYSLRVGSEVVCVFNDSYAAGQPQNF